MSLVSAGKDCIDYVPIHFKNEVSFALGPPPFKFWDLPPARSVIHSQPTTISIIGKRGVLEILSDAWLSIVSSRHYTAMHFTVPRRRQVM